MWRIPLSNLNYGPEEEQAVVDVLRSGWLSMGPRTEEFEAQAASYLGVKHAFAVANCTCALELAYACVINEWRERNDPSTQPMVIVPDITFVATANAAIKAGAQVVLADITDKQLPHTRQQQLAPLIAQYGKSIAAVAVMHYAGFDAGASEARQSCDVAGIALIEDAAHAIGGTCSSNRMLGAIGDTGCFSFFANKNMSTGEGGLIVTNQDNVADSIRLLRSHGMTSLTYNRHRVRGHGYDVLLPGHNYRCTEIMAALGIEQLKKLDRGNNARRELYTAYTNAFETSDEFSIPFKSGDEIARSACHIFPLVCRTSALRDLVRSELNEASIQTSHHYPPLHTFTAFRNTSFSSGQEAFPNATDYASRQITLPLHPGLKQAEQEEVIETVLRAVKKVS